MDLTTLGLDAALVAAIIAGTKLFTRMLDPRKDFERWWPLLPILLAVPVATLRYWGDGALKVALMVIVYGFVAGHLYKTGKSVLGK